MVDETRVLAVVAVVVAAVVVVEVVVEVVVAVGTPTGGDGGGGLSSWSMGNRRFLSAWRVEYGDGGKARGVVGVCGGCRFRFPSVGVDGRPSTMVVVHAGTVARAGSMDDCGRAGGKREREESQSKWVEVAAYQLRFEDQIHRLAQL